MQAPEIIEPKTLADYLDVMGKAMFQSGISWRVVESKWPGSREALHGFDPRIIATFSEADLDRLAQDPRLIRSRRKLAALVENARSMLELEEQHGSFQNYLRSHGGFDETIKDVRKQFKYMGDAGTFYFLWVVGEETPDYEEWCRAHH